MQYRQLEEQCRVLCASVDQGTTPREALTQFCEANQVRDEYGCVWKLNHETGRWMMRKGKGWVLRDPVDDGAPFRSKYLRLSPRIRPTGSQPPTSFFGFLWHTVVHYIRNLPYTFLFQAVLVLVTYVLTILFHFWILVVKNEGFGLVSSSGIAWWFSLLNLQGVANDSLLFYLCTGFLLSLLLGKLLCGQVGAFLRSAGTTPRWLVKGFREQPAPVVPIAVSMALTSVSGLMTNNRQAIFALFLSSLVVLVSQEQSLLYQFLKFGWKDLRRLLISTPARGSDGVFALLELGAACGLLVGFLLRGNRFWTYAVMLLLLAAALFVGVMKHRQPGIVRMLLLLFLFQSVLMSSFSLLAATVRADDGGWNEGGGRFTDWYNSPGAPIARGAGRGAAASAAAGAAAGAAAAAAAAAGTSGAAGASAGASGASGSSGTGPSSGNGTGSGTGPSSGSGTGSGTGPGSGSGTGSGTGPGSGNGTGSGTGPGSGSGRGSGTGPGSGSGTGSGTGPGSGNSTGSGTGPGSGSSTGSGTGPGSGSGTGTGSGTGGPDEDESIDDGKLDDDGKLAEDEEIPSDGESPADSALPGDGTTSGNGELLDDADDSGSLHADKPDNTPPGSSEESNEATGTTAGDGNESPDGGWKRQLPDGSTKTEYPNGSTVIERPDGTTITTTTGSEKQVVRTETRYPDGTVYREEADGRNAWFDQQGNRFERGENSVTTYIERPGTKLGYDKVIDYGDGAKQVLTGDGHLIATTPTGETITQYANPNADVYYDETGTLHADYGTPGEVWYDDAGTQYTQNETNVTSIVKRPGTKLGYDKVIDYGDGAKQVLTGDGHMITTTPTGETVTQYANPNADVYYDETGTLHADYGTPGEVWYDEAGTQYIQNETNVTSIVKRPGTKLGYDKVIDYGDGAKQVLTGDGHMITTTPTGETVTQYANPNADVYYDETGTLHADYGIPGEVWYDGAGVRHVEFPSDRPPI